MIRDSYLLLASALSCTESVASTYYVDNQATGGVADGGWLVATVTTAFTKGLGSPTAAFEVQTASDTSFTTTTLETVASSGEYLSTQLTLGTQIKVKIAGPTKRYIRGYVRCATTTDSVYFTAAAVNLEIVKDADFGSTRVLA